MSKRGILLVGFLLLVLAGCVKETCQKDQIVINDTCCSDRNYDFICDDTQDLPICNDGKCHAEENCSTCWQDCGVCKVITTVYVPVNFSLKNVSNYFDMVLASKLLFRKDLEFSGNVSDYYYSEEKFTKFQAAFLDTKYHPPVTDKSIILSRIKPPYDNQSLLYVFNLSRYYIVHKPLTDERERYVQRFTKNTAKDDYPVAGTGHATLYRYKDWTAKNFTELETVFYDNTSLMDDMVWSVFASTTDYTIDYITGQFESEFDEDEIQVKIDQHKFVTETKINYMNTITFVCARNMAVTLIEPSYSVDNRYISRDLIGKEVISDRDALLKRAKMLRELCEDEFSNGIFVP